MPYNWQLPDWPHFNYRTDHLEKELVAFAHKAGRIDGLAATLTEQENAEAVIDLMISEALKTSEIEGEYLSRVDVASSLRNELGLHTPPVKVRDPKAIGISELMVEVRKTWNEPLTVETLFGWHRLLMKGSYGVRAGTWREHGANNPMQIVSGAIGKEKVHFEAPPSSRVPEEMDNFIQWFNHTVPGGNHEILHAPIRSGVAHLYFESIHPFDDGNGRMGRAISEKALSQGSGHPVLLSLSQAIEINKKNYDDALKVAQQTDEISEWLEYFLDVCLAAQTHAEALIQFTVDKAKFFDRWEGTLNERQLKAIRRVLSEGPHGFEGGLSAGKYRSITGTSRPTASRDLQDLVEKGIAKMTGGGRSVRYEILLKLS